MKLRPSIADIAVLVVVMVALFLLFPRFGPLWGMPQDAGGRTGLSGSLRLGAIADLANDDSIAFRLRFFGPRPLDRQLYFRGPVLAAGVRVVADDDTPSPTVLGPWEVGLAPGRYAVDVDDHPGPELLRARSPGGSVELHHGRVEIVVAAASTTADASEEVGRIEAGRQLDRHLAAAGGADAFAIPRVLPRRAGAGAGRVILRRVGQDRELAPQLHLAASCATSPIPATAAPPPRSRADARPRAPRQRPRCPRRPRRPGTRQQAPARRARASPAPRTPPAQPRFASQPTMSAITTSRSWSLSRSCTCPS